MYLKVCGKQQLEWGGTVVVGRKKSWESDMKMLYIIGLVFKTIKQI